MNGYFLFRHFPVPSWSVRTDHLMFCLLILGIQLCYILTTSYNITDTVWYCGHAGEVGRLDGYVSE